MWDGEPRTPEVLEGMPGRDAGGELRVLALLSPFCRGDEEVWEEWSHLYSALTLCQGLV